MMAKPCETTLIWAEECGMQRDAMLTFVCQTSKSERTNINQRSSDFVLGRSEQSGGWHRQQIIPKETEKNASTTIAAAASAARTNKYSKIDVKIRYSSLNPSARIYIQTK